MLTFGCGWEGTQDPRSFLHAGASADAIQVFWSMGLEQQHSCQVSESPRAQLGVLRRTRSLQDALESNTGQFQPIRTIVGVPQAREPDLGMHPAAPLGLRVIL